MLGPSIYVVILIKVINAGFHQPFLWDLMIEFEKDSVLYLTNKTWPHSIKEMKWQYKHIKTSTLDLNHIKDSEIKFKNSELVIPWKVDQSWIETLTNARKSNIKDLWLFHSKSNVDFNPLKLDLDDDFFIVSDEMVLQEVYKISSGFMKTHHEDPILVFNTFGSWNPYGFSIKEPIKWERRKNLQGTHWIITSLPDPPYVLDFQSNQLNGGIYVDIFKAIQNHLNFTYDLILPPDGNFGAMNENGTWNGMIKSLIHHEVDALICSMTVTLARIQVASFTISPMREFKRFFIPNPKGSMNFWVYTSPFNMHAWLAILVFNIVVPPLVFWIVK